MPNDGGAQRAMPLPAAAIAEAEAKLRSALEANDINTLVITWADLRDNQKEIDPPLADRVRRQYTKFLGPTTLPLIARAKSALSLLDARREARATVSFPRVWIDDIELDLTNDDYLKYIIGRRSLILIYGPSGDGKTFWSIDVLSHIAAGSEWRGRRVRPCLVVYIAAEAGAGIARRFLAWSGRHLSDTREGRLPLAIITRGANLLNSVEVEALLLELRQISAEAGLPIGIVAFDTLSRSTPGGDEGAEDMSQAVGAADRIRDEFDGASTLFIHHSGKDTAKGARGHSSLFAAADTVISVVENIATVEKSRDGQTGEQFPFRLEVVELGQDQDGDAVTTCVVVPGDTDTPRKTKQQKLGADEQVALDALREEVGASGEPMPGTSVIPAGVRAVRVDKWRQRFHSRIGDSRDVETQGAKRQAWNRGRKGLIAKHLAGCWEDFAWPI